MKQILITGHGLHRVDFTDTEPAPRACSSCHGGTCPFPIACEVPESSVPPRSRFPTVSAPVLVGALLALPGVVMFAVEGLRYFLQP